MSNSSIKDLLRLIVKEEKIYSKTCRVLSVDGNLCDVEPIDGSADILEVKISPDGTGVRLTPAIDSIVQVSFLANTEAYISSFSSVSKIEIDCDNIVFNGGDNDGLVLIRELVTKLNNLENKVNDIINMHNTHVHPGVTSGASSTLVTTSLVIGTLTPTNQADIEDTKIKH